MIQRLVLFMVLSVAAALASTVNVAITKPVSAASPVEIQASAQSSCCKIDGWYIYVDGNTAWHTTNQVSSIDAFLKLSAGSHSIAVRAWDTTGAYGTANLNVTVADTLSISMSSPTSGATLASPVTFNVQATSPNGIDGWVIYADGNNVYQINNQSNTLNASVTMTAGTHSVFVRAWDKVSGYVTTPPISLTISPPPSSLTVPSTATVLANVQNAPDSSWTGTSEEAGPSNVTSDFWTAGFQTKPSLSGSSREFHVGGPAWTAALFYHRLGQYSNMAHILTDFWVYVDSASMANVWDMEFDAYQAVGGYEYMMGSHCLFGRGTWQGWNQASSFWLDIPAPCQSSAWVPNQWHHVQWLMERIPNSTNYKYDSLVVDGVTYNLNITEPAGATDWSDVFGVQWQMDTNGNSGTVNWWIDKVTVSLW